MPQRRNPVDLSAPKSGPYLVRLVPKGWETPAWVQCEGGLLRIQTDGVWHPDVWTVAELPDLMVAATVAGDLFSHPVFRILLFGRVCTEAEFMQRSSLKDWAAQHHPDHPCLHPTQPIDRSKLPAESF